MSIFADVSILEQWRSINNIIFIVFGFRDLKISQGYASTDGMWWFWKRVPLILSWTKGVIFYFPIVFPSSVFNDEDVFCHTHTYKCGGNCSCMFVCIKMFVSISIYNRKDLGKGHRKTFLRMLEEPTSVRKWDFYF